MRAEQTSTYCVVSDFLPKVTVTSKFLKKHSETSELELEKVSFLCWNIYFGTAVNCIFTNFQVSKLR